MSDPGPDPDADVEQLRTELQHASETAPSDITTSVENLTEALGDLDESGTEPKQDNLESIRAELVRLEDDAEGDTRKHLERARERTRAILKDRLAADQEEP